MIELRQKPRVDTFYTECQGNIFSGILRVYVSGYIIGSIMTYNGAFFLPPTPTLTPDSCNHRSIYSAIQMRFVLMPTGSMTEADILTNTLSNVVAATAAKPYGIRIQSLGITNLQ